MASVTLSKGAPQEEIQFTLAQTSFKVKPGGAYKTDDRDVLAEAAVHPWLDVPVDDGEAVYNFPEAVNLREDPLSRYQTHAFDPAPAREDVVINPVAIDAGKDQNKKVETGGVDETLAAAEATTPKEKK